MKRSLAAATSSLVTLALFACDPIPEAPSGVGGDRSDATTTNDAGTDVSAPSPGPSPAPSLAALPTFDDLPECDRDEPSLACIRALFAPLGDASRAWPFDAARVAGALGVNQFAVARGWDLTAHHVLEADLQIGTYGCFFDAFRYAEDLVPFSGPGCGKLLVAGGHPHALVCKAGPVPMGDCIDQVPYAESFDLVVARGPERAAVLDLAPAPPSIGDPVYVVGYPAFPWLSDADRAALAEGYPLVSYGKVVAVDGRGIVSNAAAFRGSSGGPLLDAHGAVLGVLSTLIGHQRAEGTSVPAALEDHYVVASAPDAQTKAVVSAARLASP